MIRSTESDVSPVRTKAEHAADLKLMKAFKNAGLEPDVALTIAILSRLQVEGLEAAQDLLGDITAAQLEQASQGQLDDELRTKIKTSSKRYNKLFEWNPINPTSLQPSQP